MGVRATSLTDKLLIVNHEQENIEDIATAIVDERVYYISEDDKTMIIIRRYSARKIECFCQNI